MRPRSVGSFFTSRSSERSKRGRGREQPLDVVAREVGDRDQVAPRRRARRAQVVGDDADLRHREPPRRDRAGRGRPRRPRRAAPGSARRARSAGSCRRSRGGSAARGGRGRRGRRAGRARGGRSRTAPRSRRGSCGPCRGRRRRGRTVAPSSGKSSSRRADDRLRVERRLAAAHAHVVAVEGDVDRAERDGDARRAPRSAARRRCASGTPRVWMPTSATSSRSGLRSMISCAIRESVRSIASSSSRSLAAASRADVFMELLSGLAGPG